MGREQHCKQISLARVGSAGSVLATLDLPPFTVCVFYTAQALGCSAGELSKVDLGLCALPRSKLSRSGSGSRVLHKGTDSVGPAFCALPRSEQLG